MKPYAVGIFKWILQDKPSLSWTTQLVRVEFAYEASDQYLEIYHKDRCSDDLDFSIVIELAHDDGPNIDHFYGHIPDTIVVDGYLFVAKLKHCRDMMLAAIVRQWVLQNVIKEDV